MKIHKYDLTFINLLKLSSQCHAVWSLKNILSDDDVITISYTTKSKNILSFDDVGN